MNDIDCDAAAEASGYEYAMDCAIERKDAEIAELRAELGAKSKDAARYRWLKENCQAVADEYGPAGQLYFGTYLFGNIDSAIDKDMGEQA